MNSTIKRIMVKVDGLWKKVTEEELKTVEKLDGIYICEQVTR